MSDKPREWFAVKRAKGSSYQFYEPNPRNRKTIEAIAPDGGNFEVTCLVEKSAYDALAAENERLREALTKIAKQTVDDDWTETTRFCIRAARKMLEK